MALGHCAYGLGITGPHGGLAPIGLKDGLLFEGSKIGRKAPTPNLSTETERVLGRLCDLREEGC